MKRIHEPAGRSKQEWENLMLECLEEARQAVLHAGDGDKSVAWERFRTVLTQYNRLVLQGERPPQAPCFT